MILDFGSEIWDLFVEKRIIFFRKSLFLAFFVPILAFPTSIHSQSGDGEYSLESSVIAGGSGKSSGGGFTLEGTSGQNNAGTNISGGDFRLRDGFWSFQQFDPTAAFVNVGGRIVYKNGQGLNRVYVTILDTQTNLYQQTQTNHFGYYSFSDIPVGQTYLITVWHKQFEFVANSRLINLDDERNDIDFVIAEDQ